jgi:uncharacterized protein
VDLYLIGILAHLVSSSIQMWLRNIYAKWMRVTNISNLTGARVARTILGANGFYEVRVEPVRGMLTDHYDPISNTVRLSEGNFGYANVSLPRRLPSPTCFISYGVEIN